MRRYWSPAAINKFKRLYPSTPMARLCFIFKRTDPAISIMAVKLGLKKTPEFVSKHARFPKGMTPWNRGVTGYMGANRTSFRKGHKPQTWLPVGSERIDRDGTLLRKVSDAKARRKRWRPIKDLIWEAKRGPIPRAASTTFANIDWMIAGAKAKKVPIIVVGTLPPLDLRLFPDRAPLIAPFNSQLTARLNGSGVYIADYHKAMVLGDGVTQNGALFMDGIHPNQAGYRVMHGVLREVLREARAGLRVTRRAERKAAGITRTPEQREARKELRAEREQRREERAEKKAK